MFVKSTHVLYPPSWCCLHAHLLSLFHVSNSLKKHLIQCLAADCKFSCWCDGNCVNLTIVIAFKYTGCILSQDKSMAVHRRGWSWASLWCLSSTTMHLWCKLLLLGKTSVYKESSVHRLTLNSKAAPEAAFDRSLWDAKELGENLTTSLSNGARTIIVERMHRSVLFHMAKWLVLSRYDSHSGKVIHLSVALMALRACWWVYDYMGHPRNSGLQILTE